MNVDKKARIKNLRELHTAIKERHYPAHMERDRVLVLHALERLIFSINGISYGLRSE